jgi:hypothetical protein
MARGLTTSAEPKLESDDNNAYSVAQIFSGIIRYDDTSLAGKLGVVPSTLNTLSCRSTGISVSEGWIRLALASSASPGSVMAISEEVVDYSKKMSQGNATYWDLGRRRSGA